MKLSQALKARIREQALEEVGKLDNLDEVNVFLYDEQLERGVKMAAASAVIQADKKTALVMVDQAPKLNWGHPCQHLLYSIDTTELYDRVEAEFPPDEYFNLRHRFEGLHTPVARDDTIRERNVQARLLPEMEAALTNAVGNRYAVLFSGQSNNRHLNDLEFLYRTLIDLYSFKAQNIFVLNYDGTIDYSGGPHPVGNWPGNNTPYRIKINKKGTKSALESTLTNLAGKLESDDFVLIHTNNHGGGPPYAAQSYLCCYPGSGDYTASDFANKLKQLPKCAALMVMMEQCHSGGFGPPILAKAKADKIHFAAACEANKSSIGGAHFDPYAYDWIAGVSGAYADGSSLSKVVDSNGDSRICATEAAAYAKAVKDPYDTPVSMDKPAGFGNHIFLDNAPELPRPSASFLFQNRAPGNFNYEMFTDVGKKFQHNWFHYGPMSWNAGAKKGKNVVGNPIAFQNRAPGNYNYEIVAREGSRLRHYWFSYNQLKWYKAQKFGWKCHSTPAVIQNHAPGNYNYEVLVREGTKLRHYWFEYGPMVWHKASLFGSKVKSDPVMFQNHAPGNYNYEVLVREGGGLRHYWFEYGPMVWHKAKKFGTGMKSAPVAFQNHAPGNFNYEVVVREGSGLRHYWFEYGPMAWHKAKKFGTNVKSNLAMFQNRAPGNFNYEVVAQEGTSLRHYWFQYGPMLWHKAKKFGSGVKQEIGLFQNHAPGNFNYELVVPEGNKWQHYWFSYAGKKWNKAKTFGSAPSVLGLVASERHLEPEVVEPEVKRKPRRRPIKAA